jgi:D-alanine-D-alanine ligase
VGEIQPEGDFYSYESKYDSGSTSAVTIPAEISPEISDTIREQALRIFRALGCSGMARVDFFIDKDTAEIYLNEVNTIPGFTDISMYPKLWEHAGIGYGELVDRLITLAMQTKLPR